MGSGVRTDAELVGEAQGILRSEAASIVAVAGALNGEIAKAVRLIHGRTGEDTHGMLVISGVGKSGLVGQRISASFASTGTPSTFLHPVEALHGDMGRVRRNDVVMLLSYSGETEELLRVVDLLKRIAVPTVAVTSSQKSSLGRVCDIVIELGAIDEVCPHGLAPTTTVNCISAVGDALVLGVMSLRNFSKEDFAAFHPAGSLGRKLLTVGQVMEFKVGENFVVHPESVSVGDVLDRDSKAAETSGARRAGAVVLIAPDGTLSGVFTDGDLRRKLRAHGTLLTMTIKEVMTANPKRVNVGALASEALAIMNRHRIDELPVVDEAGKPVGLVDVQDLVRLRIVE